MVEKKPFPIVVLECLVRCEFSNLRSLANAAVIENQLMNLEQSEMHADLAHEVGEALEKTGLSKKLGELRMFPLQNLLMRTIADLKSRVDPPTVLDLADAVIEESRAIRKEMSQTASTQPSDAKESAWLKSQNSDDHAY